MFKLRYDNECLEYYIEKNQFLQNLDKKELKKSYRNARLKFRRENLPSKGKRKIINEMQRNGEIVAVRRLRKA